MKCDCEHLDPLFLEIVSRDLPHLVYPADLPKVQADLKALANSCGYEKDAQHHYKWIQFPKRQGALKRLEETVGGRCNIIHEHDDGDITVSCEGSGKAVITTDGEIFVEQKL